LSVAVFMSRVTLVIIGWPVSRLKLSSKPKKLVQFAQDRCIQACGRQERNLAYRLRQGLYEPVKHERLGGRDLNHLIAIAIGCQVTPRSNAGVVDRLPQAILHLGRYSKHSDCLYIHRAIHLVSSLHAPITITVRDFYAYYLESIHEFVPQINTSIDRGD
jgi:hypothetical protein